MKIAKPICDIKRLQEITVNRELFAKKVKGFESCTK